MQYYNDTHKNLENCHLTSDNMPNAYCGLIYQTTLYTTDIRRMIVTGKEADVGLVTSVQRHVTAQVLGPEEGLAALLADEVALIGVRPQVTAHVTRGREARRAQRVGTFERLFLSMHPTGGNGQRYHACYSGDDRYNTRRVKSKLLI